jgi:hypothetical protein
MVITLTNLGIETNKTSGITAFANFFYRKIFTLCQHFRAFYSGITYTHTLANAHNILFYST